MRKPSLLDRLAREARGASMVEYVLLLGVLVLLSVLALKTLGPGHEKAHHGGTEGTEKSK